MKNKSPRFLTLIFSFFLFSVIVLTSCISFRTSDKSALKAYKKKGIELKIHHKPFQSIPIRYLETGETTDDAPLILFLHGAPGSSNAFDTYLQDSVLLSKATLVSVDRLGYGYSNYGKAETS
ncbi:MAG: alpha/beta fold hydrolase [Cyclobacteriaceae bacterium]